MKNKQFIELKIIDYIWKNKFSKYMEEQVLRNLRGIRLGDIREKNGKYVLYDARGIRKGEYDPQKNVTRDERGAKVGTGNLLATLL